MKQKVIKRGKQKLMKQQNQIKFLFRQLTSFFVNQVPFSQIKFFFRSFIQIITLQNFMNRLSLLAGPIPPNPKQNFKEAAFLQYLKSFSQNGLQTLERLESQFNRENASTTVNDDFKAFQKIKTLIGSYELFVLEMNDSCEFIEVPELGTCLLKLFIQLIGIVKWSLQKLVLEKQQNIIATQSLNNNPSLEITQMNQTTASLLNFFNSSKSKRQEKTMRNTLNGKINFTPTQKQSCCPECLKITVPENIYKVKQQATLQLRNINEEIIRISKQYAEELKKARQQQEERNQLEKFIEKRQESGKMEKQIGLGDHSRNEDLLTQIVYTLNRKGQAMKKFADLRMTSIIDSNKLQSVSEEDYENLKVQVSTEMTQRLTSAKHKLALLFKQHILQHEKFKKSQLVHTAIQIDQNQSMKMFKYHQQKSSKKLKAQIKRLQRQLDCEKGLNEEFKKLLAQKSIQFQSQVFKYRNELLNVQIKSRIDTNMPKPQESFIFDKRQYKTSFYCERNSEISIHINQFEDPFLNNINQEAQSDQSQFYSASKRIQKPSFLKIAKRVTQQKKLFKYKKLADNSTDLQLVFSVMSYKIDPTPKSLSRQAQLFDKQKQQAQSMRKQKLITKSRSVQTIDQLQRKKTIADELLIKSRKKIKDVTTKTSAIQSPNTYRRVNLTSYMKKNSAHEQIIGKNNSSKKYSKRQDYNLLNCVNTKCKNSKFLQRVVKYNTVQHPDRRNEFTPLGLTESQNNGNGYQRKWMQSRQQNSRRKKGMMQKQTDHKGNQIELSFQNQQNTPLKIRFKSFQGHDLQKDNKENIISEVKLK